MMLNSGMIRSAPETMLDIYFRQCSVRVTCTDLAVMAATLADGGVNPVTGESRRCRANTSMTCSP